MAVVNMVKGESLGNGRVLVTSTANLQPVKIQVKQEELQNQIAQLKSNDMVKDLKVGKTSPKGMVEVTYTLKDTKPQKFAVPEAKADEFIASYQKNADSSVGMKKPALLGVGVGLLGGWGVSKLLGKLNKWFKYPLVGIASLGLMVATAGLTISRNVRNFAKKEQAVVDKYSAERLG